MSHSSEVKLEAVSNWVLGTKSEFSERAARTLKHQPTSLHSTSAFSNGLSFVNKYMGCKQRRHDCFKYLCVTAKRRKAPELGAKEYYKVTLHYKLAEDLLRKRQEGGHLC